MLELDACLFARKIKILRSHRSRQQAVDVYLAHLSLPSVHRLALFRLKGVPIGLLLLQKRIALSARVDLLFICN